MIFVQKYTVNEYIFGRQSFRFAVSDNYEDLFKQDNEITITETSIFQLESVKQDLELDDGSFAIDEMKFSINSASCLTADDTNALYFCLDATNILTGRYAALFFDESPGLENLRFIGKIDSKVSGDDIKWKNDFFSSQINPERNYHFSALSFDISLLQDCSLNDRITNEQGEVKQNIYQRLFTETNYTWLKGITAYRYSLDTFSSKKYVPPLLSLYQYLNKVLELSVDILNETRNINIELSLDESEMGFDILPATKDGTMLAFGDYFNSGNWYPSNSKRVKPTIGSIQTTDKSPLYIHRRLIHERFGDVEGDTEVIDGVVTFKKESTQEKNLSFQIYDNAAELFFSIARSLGCFIVIVYENYNSLKVKFVPRKDIVSDNLTYIINPESAKFDSSMSDDDKKINYYSIATTYIDEGKDFGNSGNTSNTVKFEKKKKTLDDNKELKSYENRMLPLSLSPTLEMHSPYGYLPFCCVSKNSYLESFDFEDYNFPAPDPNGLARNKYKDRIHTAIYIKTNPFDLSGTQPEWIYRPAAGLISKIGNEDKLYTELGDYVNEIYLGTQEAYKTEYELTVPLWNGFNDIQGFTGSSWKKIKPGSKIQLSETVKKFNGIDFTEEEVSRTYIVVGIEINLQKPETKLRLVNISAFSFGNAEEIPDFSPMGYYPESVSNSYESENYVNGFTIENGFTIVKGNPVRLLSNGNIAPAENKSSSTRTIGIALSNGNEGEKIYLQVSGVVTLPEYNFSIGNVYLRGHELSQTILSDKNETEDVLSIIGQALNSTSIKLNIREWIYE